MDRVSPAAESNANPIDSSASMPASHQTDVPPQSRIDSETEAVIQQYFETFNRSDFAATAALFASGGALYPPFESAVVGQEAIAAYLNQEAQGMRIEMRQCVQETNDAGETEVKVAGKVQTPFFGVNVTWTFGLNECSADRTAGANRLEILSVRIKLLAALEDLLKLKQ